MRSEDLGLNLDQLSTEHVLDWEVHYNYFFLITQSVFDTTNLWVSNDVSIILKHAERERERKRERKKEKERERKKKKKRERNKQTNKQTNKQID